MNINNKKVLNIIVRFKSVINGFLTCIKKKKSFLRVYNT